MEKESLFNNFLSGSSRCRHVNFENMFPGSYSSKLREQQEATNISWSVASQAKTKRVACSNLTPKNVPTTVRPASGQLLLAPEKRFRKRKVKGRKRLREDSECQRLTAMAESRVPVWYIPDGYLTSRSRHRPQLVYQGTEHAGVIRRKPVAKDNTGALKLWLLQHKKNPYPNKPEKIMLAILSKMTLTQVSTWFANARRRLKKEFTEEDIDILENSLQQDACYTEH